MYVFWRDYRVPVCRYVRDEYAAKGRWAVIDGCAGKFEVPFKVELKIGGKVVTKGMIERVFKIDDGLN